MIIAWFIAVQFFACFGLIFEFVVLALLSVSFMTNIRFKFYFVFPITILTFVSRKYSFSSFICTQIKNIKKRISSRFYDVFGSTYLRYKR
jgi:hypothetical protein